MKIKVTEAPFTTKHEAIVYCEQLERANVKKVGDLKYQISTEKGSFDLNDSSRPLSLIQRQTILFFIFCLGLPISIVILVYWPSISQSLGL